MKQHLPLIASIVIAVVLAAVVIAPYVLAFKAYQRLQTLETALTQVVTFINSNLQEKQ